jgi:hypothetical protein
VCDDWTVLECQQFQVPFHLLPLCPNHGVAPTHDNIAASMAGGTLQDRTVEWNVFFLSECQNATQAVGNADFLTTMSFLPTVSEHVNGLHGMDVIAQATHVMTIVKETQGNIHTWNIDDGHMQHVSAPANLSQKMEYHFKHAVGALLSEWAEVRGSRCRCDFDLYK